MPDTPLRQPCGLPPLPTGEDFAGSATRLAGHAALLLGWRPHDFWSATPAELAAALAPLAGEAGERPANARDVSRLMEQYPDG